MKKKNYNELKTGQDIEDYLKDDLSDIRRVPDNKGALHMNDNQGPPENPDDADDEEQADINRKQARLAELRSQSQSGQWTPEMGQEISDLLDYLRDR